eukprot:5375800-Prymnesium_polylepis.1
MLVARVDTPPATRGCAEGRRGAPSGIGVGGGSSRSAGNGVGAVGLYGLYDDVGCVAATNCATSDGSGVGPNREPGAA